MITRRTMLGSLAAGALATGQSTTSKPNILFVLADDLGMECLNCYGGTSYKTPNLDRFAASGVRFTHGYAQPLCTPTRVQLMTGQHNFRNYVGFGLMDPNEKTFGHMMQQAGYKTCIAGKWQFYSYEEKGSPRWRKGMVPEKGGFDDFLLWHDHDTETKGSRYADPVMNRNGKMVTDAKGKYGPDLFTDHLGKFMERNRNQPFFAYYSMALTHGPFNMTPKSKDWASGDRLKDDPKYYADMVEYMDEDFGRLMKKLDDLGLAEKTLVIFFADNGTPPEITSRMGDRLVPGGKQKTTEAGMHVPLLARWKGVSPAGKVCSDLIDTTDVLPTMMEATGAKWFPGRPLDGRSFLPQVKGQKGNPRESLFAHFDPHPGCKAPVTPTRLAWDHRYKLYIDGRFFDIVKDPLEKSPLTGELAPEAKKARTRLQANLDAMGKAHPPVFHKFETDGRKPY